jgi:hypothetical protein
MPDAASCTTTGAASAANRCAPSTASFAGPANASTGRWSAVPGCTTNHTIPGGSVHRLHSAAGGRSGPV